MIHAISYDRKATMQSKLSVIRNHSDEVAHIGNSIPKKKTAFGGAKS